MAAPLVAAKAATSDTGLIVLGLGALVLLRGVEIFPFSDVREGVEDVVETAADIAKEAADQINIVPETEEFMRAVWSGAENTYIYHPPAPEDYNKNVSQEWWQAFAEDAQAAGYWSEPGTAIVVGMPAPPITIEVIEPSIASKAGGFVHDEITGLYTDPFIDLPGDTFDVPSIQSGWDTVSGWLFK